VIPEENVKVVINIPHYASILSCMLSWFWLHFASIFCV